MSLFDAVTHAMATLATGGYSTRDASFGGFSAQVQWVGVVFMIAGALPFLLYVRAARGDWTIIRDRQAQIMVFVLVIAIIVLALWLRWHGGRPLDGALRLAAFNATSVMTTTGFASEDFAIWARWPRASSSI
jgi:trk system potassium uptake protein TrkH